MDCVYCFNNNPQVLTRTSNNSTYEGNLELDGSSVILPISTKLSVSKEHNINYLQDSYKILCEMCNREYKIMLNSENKEVIKNFVRVSLSQTPSEILDGILTQMASFGLSYDDVMDGLFAVTKPLKYGRKFKNYMRKGKNYISGITELHVLFNYNENRYFIVIYNNSNDNTFTITHVEKLWV